MSTTEEFKIPTGAERQALYPISSGGSVCDMARRILRIDADAALRVAEIGAERAAVDPLFSAIFAAWLCATCEYEIVVGSTFSGELPTMN
jgi:hypothetical protein